MACPSYCLMVGRGSADLSPPVLAEGMHAKGGGVRPGGLVWARRGGAGWGDGVGHKVGGGMGRGGQGGWCRPQGYGPEGVIRATGAGVGGLRR